MKGSNKQFARYLESELNDEYLQPSENYHDEYNQEDIFELISRQETKLKKSQKQELSGNLENKPKKNPYTHITPLTKPFIKDLILRLGNAAQDCFANVVEVHKVIDDQVLDAFKAFHQTHETIPVMFCSHVIGEAVYLWQINKLCPVQDITSRMALDAGSKGYRLNDNISFLLLAKIMSTENEKIVGMKLLGNNQLLVRFKTENFGFVIKSYNITDFAQIAKVNPFSQEVLANDLYSAKLTFKGSKSADGCSYNIEITSSRKKTQEELRAEAINPNYHPIEKELIVKRIVLEGYPYMFSAFRGDFSESFITSQGVIVITDQDVSTVVAMKETDIVAARYDIGVMKGMKYGSNSMLFSTRVDCLINYELNFENYPDIKIQEISYPFPERVQNHISHYDFNVQERRDLLSSFLAVAYNCGKFPYYVSDVKFKLENPKVVNQIPVPEQPRIIKAKRMKKKKKIEEEEEIEKKEQEKEEEEKVETNIIKKIDKMRNILNLENKGKISLEGTNEMLKEIRGDVSSKLTEIVEYYNTLKEQPWRQRDMELPKEVSKAELKLYQEIKDEKTKIKMDREKEKARKKNERLTQDHDM